MKKNSIRYWGLKSKARSLRTYPPRYARGLCHAGFETLTFAPCSVMYYYYFFVNYLRSKTDKKVDLGNNECPNMHSLLYAIPVL